MSGESSADEKRRLSHLRNSLHKQLRNGESFADQRRRLQHFSDFKTIAKIIYPLQGPLQNCFKTDIYEAEDLCPTTE